MGVQVNLFSSSQRPFEAYETSKALKTTILELSFAERHWSDSVHTRTVPFLSRNLHGIVRLTTGGFVPKIMLTHGEIRDTQLLQMGV